MDRRTQWLLAVSSLAASFALALYVRMYRAFQWGWWLDEFDPYVRYYLAKYTVEHGAGWWWTGARFDQFWYPWGVDWSRVLLPGASLYGVLLYSLLRPFGVDLWHAAVAAPAVFNAMSVFSMFYLGHRLGGFWGRLTALKTGMVAAALTAVAPAFIERGFAGWFDDEPISLFLIPLSIALFLDGLRRPWMGALAGAAGGYVAWTWGAHFYVWNYMGLLVVSLALYYVVKAAFRPAPRAQRGRRRAEEAPQPLLPFSPTALLVDYLLYYLVYAAFVSTALRYGVSTLRGPFNILPLAGLAVAVLFRLLWPRIAAAGPAARRYVLALLAAGAAAVAALLAAVEAGLIGGKFLAVLSPTERNAIVSSVAEHGITAFGQVALRYAPLLPFIIAAVPSMLNPAGLAVLVYLMTAGYAAITMVRLLVLLAPAAVAAAALGMVRLLEARRLGPLVLLVAVAAAAGTASTGFNLAYSPQQIVTSAVSVSSPDFLDALMWLKTRLPPHEPVASWWDYGYWISVLGNKTSLADNSTINATQIGMIGLGFLAPAPRGLQVFTDYFHVRYLLAIMPFASTRATLPALQGQDVEVLIHEYPAGGDFLKSYWMARIAFDNLGAYARQLLGAGSTAPEAYIYTRLMSYPSTPPYGSGYAYFTIGGSATSGTPYPVPLQLNNTLYSMLFSKERIYWMWGNGSQYMPWIFEGVYTPAGFTAFNALRLTAGNVGLPGQRGYSYYISGFTTRGMEAVVDPLTGQRACLSPITAAPWGLRPVYVSRPYGWVVIYEATGRPPALCGQ